MDINLTFCVQVINFVFFYYVVSRYFLKPFALFIQAKVRSRESVLKEFAAREEHLKSLVHARTDLVTQFKNMLKTRYVLPVHTHVENIKEQPTEEISQKEEDALTATLIEKMVARIKDAY